MMEETNALISHGDPENVSIQNQGESLPISKKRTIYGLLLGQVLSLLITGTGICSNYLAQNFNAHIPTTQSLANYVLLALVYGSILIKRKTPLKVPWYWYLLISIADVEANAVVVKAYQYTSIAMVFLLDCFVIPCVMLYTWIFPKLRLRVSYQFVHFAGVIISMCGVVALVVGDLDSLGGVGTLLGDILVLISAALYAASNVSQESIVKHHDYVEFLGMLGIFGAAVSTVQASLLEWKAVTEIDWNVQVVLLLIGFVFCLWSIYSIAPFVLKWCSATVMNMSLLTSDVFGLVAGMYLFGFQPSVLYIIGFAAIMVGIVVYNMRQIKKTH